MTEINITETLEKLEQSLKKMKTLLAWEQLKLAEQRPEDNPQFIGQDSLWNDLRNHYLFFLARSFDLHGQLINAADSVMPEVERTAYWRKLRDLEGEFRQLRLKERFERYPGACW